MAVRFARSGFSIIKDHNELANRGVRTHEELDTLFAEVEEARGGFSSLNDRLLDIVSRIGTGGDGGGGSTEISSFLYYVYTCTEDNVSNIRIKEGFFRKGLNELEVFRGGLRQLLDDDYKEIDNKEIEFFEPLKSEEIVVLRVRDRFGLVNSLGFHSEYFIVNEKGVKDFTLTCLFDRDGKYLEVYLNGVLMTLGEDYVILTTNSIRFKETVPLGSLVYFRIADKIKNEEPVIIQEKIVAESGKYEYSLTKFNYEPGKEELEIFVMGIRLTPGVDYEETSPSTFKLLNNVPHNSVILACKENAGSIRSRHTHCYGIIPIGVVDGENNDFLLPHIPQKGSLLLFVGGVRQGLDTYVVEGNRLFIDTPPPKDTDIFVDYVI